MATRAKPAWTNDPALKALGSLKAAVVLIFTLAAVCVTGLLYEGEYGTPAAQADIYKAWWFNLLFVLLAGNIASAALVRYPWPKRLTGFVITHLGLLVLITGTLITRIWGIEGQMQLVPGQQKDSITILERRVLTVRLPDGQAYTVAADHLPARVGRPPQRLGDSAWALGVQAYWPHAERVDRWEPDPTGQAPPGLRLELHGRNFGTMEAWLHPTDPQRHRRQLPGLLLLSQALNGPEDEQWFRTVGRKRRTYRFEYRVPEGAVTGTLIVTGPGGVRAEVPISTAAASGADLGDGATLSVSRVFKDALVRPGPGGTSVVEEAESRGLGPAVRVAVRWEGGAQAPKTVFARLPDAHGGGAHDDEKLPNAVMLGLKKDGTVLARLLGENLDLTVPAAELKPGSSLQTPWAGITLRLAEVHLHLRTWSEVVDASGKAASMGKHADPGVQLVLVGPGGEATTTTRFRETAPIRHPKGPASVRWDYDRHPLGFTIRLKEFRKVDQPGSRSAAAFESDVVIEDALRGRKEQVTIAMNQPLKHGGPAWMPGLDWAFYQASYEPLPGGGGYASYLQAAYDPGYPVVSVGAVLICFGIFTMFYLVPYFRPRKPGGDTTSGGTAEAA